MSYIKSLPGTAVLIDVFRKFPDTARPIIDLHEAIMRKASPFSPAQRELIAAYVSGLNGCSYCHGIHGAVAKKFGISEGLLEDLLKDIDSSTADENMKPVLRYAKKLTFSPSTMTPEDAEAIYDAGWDESALHDVVLVCGLFNMMNRVVDGLGLEPEAGYHDEAAERLMEESYSGLNKLLDDEQKE